jgi:hypothetical protein
MDLSILGLGGNIDPTLNFNIASILGTDATQLTGLPNIHN